MIKIDDLFSIKNKVIIITGAGNGIGKILAEEMWKRNAIIYSIDKIINKIWAGIIPVVNISLKIK